MFGKLKKIITLQKSVKKLIGKNNSLKYYNVMPKNPLHDDLYLVAFPKSGITWLSVLMANVNLKCSGLDIKASYYNVRDFIPDIHQTRYLKTNILKFPGFRVIKSHSEYNPFYIKIIYLIRDPKDVMVSYYYFLKNLGAFQGNISELIRSKSFGINAWTKHIESWFEETRISQFINFIRYEDIKSNTKGILKHIYELHGLNLSEDIYDYAVRISSFKEMKKNEEYYSKGNLTINPDFKFHRKGIVGGYKAEFTEDDEKFIIKKTNRWLKVFGYE